MGAGRLILPLQLSADYSYDMIPVTAMPPGAADVGAVAFALIYLGLVVWTARRYPVVMFALSWSALTYLLIESAVSDRNVFGERLLYLPSIGFALLLAAAFERLADSGGGRRRAASALLAAVTLLLGARFVVRAGDWANDARLFETTVIASPRSAKAQQQGLRPAARRPLRGGGRLVPRGARIAPGSPGRA